MAGKPGWNQGGRLQQAADKYAAELAAREQDAFRTLTTAYTSSYREMLRRLEQVVEVRERAIAKGLPVSPAWVYQQERWLELMAQVGRELEQAARITGDVLTGEQRAAIQLGEAHAQGLVETSLGVTAGQAPVSVAWSQLSRGAVEQALGFQREGGPLRELLAGLADDGVTRIGGQLVVGVATGLNPRELGRILSREMGGNLARATTIARTETLRAYREATRQAYIRNQHLVAGWVWVAALDRRCCAACWSMHGQTFKLEVKLDGHPNCRCRMIPETRSWAEITGQPAERFEGMETRASTIVRQGSDVFDELPVAAKAEIVGPRKLALLDDGKIELRDLVHRPYSRAWGTMRRVASEKQALESAAKREARKA